MISDLSVRAATEATQTRRCLRRLLLLHQRRLGGLLAACSAGRAFLTGAGRAYLTGHRLRERLFVKATAQAPAR
jgi:hypothetical protein